MPKDKYYARYYEDQDKLLGVKTRRSSSRRSSEKKSHSLLWYLWWPFKIVLLLGLPFVLLIRLSVWLNQSLGWGGWSSLAVGIFATSLLLLIYGHSVYKAFGGKRAFSLKSVRPAALIILGYVAFTLFTISDANLKSSDLKSTYRSLHPVLRVSLNTLTFIDRDLIITDTSREPADYKRMGLSPLENSLHYEQRTGYVHAVDLRTLRRWEIRNALIRGYFWVMGFKTLRHTGTADHLHVSLPVST